MAAKLLAILIFCVMFGLIIWDKFERHLVTLSCGGLTLVLVFGLCLRSWNAAAETLSLSSFLKPEFWYSHGAAETSAGVNWATILFIAGMMIMVEGLAEAGFFRWLCMELAALVHYRPLPLFVVFMVMSAFLAMFIDSITVIMFLAAVTIELGRLLTFDPVPMILAEVFCANLGGAATMCGDPPNIIIGTALGYSFGDFIGNTGLIAVLSLVMIVIYFLAVFRSELAAPSSPPPGGYPDPKTAITSKRRFAVSCIIFACAVVLLVSHGATGLTVASIGLIIALATLATAGKRAGQFLRQADWNTLLFFVGLFIVVGGLEQTGVLDQMAALIGSLCQGNIQMLVVIILWISAVASAFVDNIPFAATMVPVIKSLAATQGADLSVLAWSLSMGTNIGGSATPIGASANVMGLSIAAKNDHIITWGRYCKKLVPAAVLVLAVSTAVILLRYF